MKKQLNPNRSLDSALMTGLGLIESENRHLLNKHDRCIMFFLIPDVYNYSIILSAFTGWSRKMLALSLNCTGCSVVRNLIVLPCVIRDCIS